MQLYCQHALQHNALAVLLRSIISEDAGQPYSEAQANADHVLYWLARHNGVS